MSLLKSSAVISGLTLLSRIAGYARDVMIAAMLGAGAVSDAFFVAFRLPNIFRALFAEGAFSAAFVPMFAKIKSKEKARDFAEKIFSILFFALLGITIIAQILMPGLVWLLASGFSDEPEKFNLSVDLTRVTFGYLLFISLVSLLGGVLNSIRKFAFFASAPLLLNLTLIISLWLFGGGQETSAYALSWGVFAAGIVQFLWLYFACVKYGYKLQLKLPKIDTEVKALLKRMLPVVLGAGVLQINVLVNTQIASYVSNGAVSYLYYADRISQFPLALIGTAIGTALLPLLSRQFREGNKGESTKTQNDAFRLAWFFAIPSAFGLAAIASPLIAMLFERGEFVAADTLMVAKALIAYCVGVPAFILVKIFVPGFYANEDTKTPVIIGIICIAANIAVSLALIYIYNFDHVALAISTSVSSWLNLILLLAVLRRRELFRFEEKTISRCLKILISGFVMMFIVKVWVLQALILAIPLYVTIITAMIIGAFTYFVMLLMLGVMKVEDIQKLVKKLKL